MLRPCVLTLVCETYHELDALFEVLGDLDGAAYLGGLSREEFLAQLF